MGWEPEHAHVSQMHDGAGWNDCWEGALARYLYEAGIASDPDPFAVLTAISVAAGRGQDSPTSPPTTLDEAAQSLRHYNLPVTWTTAYQDAMAAGWSIVYLDGRQLRPAQYPTTFFEDTPGPNHFILWLPFWNGADNWFNDPLAWDNGQQDCQYDLASVQAAFAGAYILPDIPARVPANVLPEPVAPEYGDLPVGWELDILEALGAPTTAENVRFLDAWNQQEHGVGGGGPHPTDTFNPFNTTMDAPGAKSTNDAGVKAYPDWQTGLDATVATLALGAYMHLVGLLRSGTATAKELGASPNLMTWGTGMFDPTTFNVTPSTAREERAEGPAEEQAEEGKEAPDTGSGTRAFLIANCAVKATPDHGPNIIVFLPRGEEVYPDGEETPHWVRIVWHDEVGWVLKDNVEYR